MNGPQNIEVLHIGLHSSDDNVFVYIENISQLPNEMFQDKHTELTRRTKF